MERRPTPAAGAARGRAALHQIPPDLRLARAETAYRAVLPDYNKLFAEDVATFREAVRKQNVELLPEWSGGRPRPPAPRAVARRSTRFLPICGGRHDSQLESPQRVQHPDKARAL